MHNTWPGGLNLPPLKVKTPAVGSALPVGPDEFAESMLTGKPYRLRSRRDRGQSAGQLGQYQQGPRGV